MLTEAQKRANQKYNAKAYDQIKIVVKKGRRDEIKQFAEKCGMSLNAYVNYLKNKNLSYSAFIFQCWLKSFSFFSHFFKKFLCA